MPLLPIRARLLLSATLALTAQTPALAGNSAPSSAQVSARVRTLLRAMTLDEKLAMVEGDTVLSENGTGTNVCVGHTATIERLKLPALCLGDGPGGVSNGMGGVTQFPAPIALAASWDPELARNFGLAMGAEQAGKGRNVVLAPTINIIRTPLWGRIAETLSEDPFLTARMAVPLVEGLQANHLIATPKHFVANNQERLRLGDAPTYEAVNAQVPERALREIYYPAFRAVVEQAHAGSLMCAYNRVNGLYACENPQTLAVPRHEWGFDGYVVTDWYFAQRSTVDAARAGLDMEMPGGKNPFGFPTFYGDPLRDAVKAGPVSMTTLDGMVRHVLTPMLRLGLPDHLRKVDATANMRSAAHTALARRIVEEGSVLLRNQGHVLPLGKDVRSIAVIGDDAGPAVQTTERYGGFVSSEGLPITTPFEAIRDRAGAGVSTLYAQGTPGNAMLPIMPDRQLRDADGKPGFTASYFTNGAWQGSPALVRHSPVPDTEQARPEGLPGSPGVWSGRWEAQFIPPTSGLYHFSVKGGGEIALFVDGQKVVYTPKHNFRAVYQGTVQLTAGKPVSLRLDYSPLATIFPGEVRLGWRAPDPSLIDKAVAAAKASDVAIVFAADVASEGADRADLSLPGDQDALIAAVAAANPRTIVVLHTAGPVLMPWRDKVAGIIAGWYAGEQAGPGLAAVLFGDVDPSGRLPVTFPASMAAMPTSPAARYPGIGTTALYDEGLEVGYRWYNAHGVKPLYPFGFGLSYADFAFSGGKISRQADGSLLVTSRLHNRSPRDGASVAQLYLTFPQQAHEPPRQLKAMVRLSVPAGASRQVQFVLPAQSLTSWDDKGARWRTAKGHYKIEIGSSSTDLPIALGFDGSRRRLRAPCPRAAILNRCGEKFWAIHRIRSSRFLMR